MKTVDVRLFKHSNKHVQVETFKGFITRIEERPTLNSLSKFEVDTYLLHHHFETVFRGSKDVTEYYVAIKKTIDECSRKTRQSYAKKHPLCYC